MYYSVTQVCRCNEETRTNSSETSLTGQPLYDTSTNELYIGDGETTIQNLSPIQNLKAGTGMTYTNGSVSLNEGTQTNAGGIKVWAENNDVYYSTPNGGGGAQLFPIIRTYHPGYNQTHSNSHTLRGTASTPYDTGEKTPHNDDISITLNYKGTVGGSGSGTATGVIRSNTLVYHNEVATTDVDNISIDAATDSGPSTASYTVNVPFQITWNYYYLVYVDSRFTVLGTPSGRLSTSTEFSHFKSNGVYTDAVIDVHIRNTTTTGYTFSGRLSCTVKISDGTCSGQDTYGVAGLKNVNVLPDITYTTVPLDVDVSIESKYDSDHEYILTTVVTNVSANVMYEVPFTYTPDGYLYEGTATKDIGDDAENIQVSPTSPSGMTATVNYSGSTATINASYVSADNSSDSIPGSAALTYNTPIYGYYTNVDTYIGSDYGARVTSTSSSVTSYSSGTSGSYFWVNMRAASQTSVSASAVSYWDSWVPAYNSYHYPIELNGVRHNFNTIDLDGVNYTATAEKYSKR